MESDNGDRSPAGGSDESVMSGAGGGSRPRAIDFIKLARPHQWTKNVFVLLGPVYGLADRFSSEGVEAGSVLEVVGSQAGAIVGAVLAFALASSACYVVNDIRDAEADRAHPRKRHRPIAAGRIAPGAASWYAVLLLVLSAASLLLIPAEGSSRLLTLLLVGLYVGNTMSYTAGLKELVIIDVMSLAIGFVLRVLGGCAAAGVEPSSWLLNVTFFLSMFLAFGKRLGERRTMGGGAEAGLARGVQAKYTDDLLRMMVVVTAVATLLTYAGYVQSREEAYRLGDAGLNLLWLTVLPASYAMLRAILQLERGAFDDPTELAIRDRAFQAAGALFVVLTALIVWSVRL